MKALPSRRRVRWDAISQGFNFDPKTTLALDEVEAEFLSKRHRYIGTAISTCPDWIRDVRVSVRFKGSRSRFRFPKIYRERR